LIRSKGIEQTETTMARENPFAPNPQRKIWLDGRLVPVEQACINVYDHGVLYGDGVFEGMRIYGGRVFKLDAHIKRLFDSARAIRLEIPVSHDQLVAATNETVKANNIPDGYVRLVVTRGVGKLGLSITKTANPTVFIIVDTIQLYPDEMYENGMAVITSSVIRNHPNALSPRIKSLNYLNNILAKIEALDAGVPEAIMFNHTGLVAEATGDNVFVVRNGIVYTPPTTDGMLEGITRDTVIELINKRGTPFREVHLSRHDLYIADECFLTGSAAEVVPVTRIDNRPVGTGQPGPITHQIINDFRECVRESA
jgi:branched-chain amino acid aminotransferase